MGNYTNSKLLKRLQRLKKNLGSLRAYFYVLSLQSKIIAINMNKYDYFYKMPKREKDYTAFKMLIFILIFITIFLLSGLANYIDMQHGLTP